MVNDRLDNGGGSPTVAALCQFFYKVDTDPDWFPGKANYDSRGHPQRSSYQYFNPSPSASTNFCNLSGSLWQSPSMSRFALMSATTRSNLASYCTEVCGRRHIHHTSMRPAYEKPLLLKPRRCTEVCGRRHLRDTSMRPAYEKASLLKPRRCTEVCGRRHLRDTSMRTAYEKPSLLKPRRCTEVCGRRHLRDTSMRPAYEKP